MHTMNDMWEDHRGSKTQFNNGWMGCLRRWDELQHSLQANMLQDIASLPLSSLAMWWDVTLQAVHDKTGLDVICIDVLTNPSLQSLGDQVQYVGALIRGSMLPWSHHGWVVEAIICCLRFAHNIRWTDVVRHVGEWCRRSYIPKSNMDQDLTETSPKPRSCHVKQHLTSRPLIQGEKRRRRNLHQ